MATRNMVLEEVADDDEKDFPEDRLVIRTVLTFETADPDDGRGVVWPCTAVSPVIADLFGSAPHNGGDADEG